MPQPPSLGTALRDVIPAQPGQDSQPHGHECEEFAGVTKRAEAK